MGSPKRFGEPAQFHFGAVTVSSHFFLPDAKVNSCLAEVEPHEVIRMSHSVQSIHAVSAPAQTQQEAQPIKNQQTTSQKATPQDKITISESAKQALAANAKPAAKG